MSPTLVVTGANRGIGLELARQARSRGARVIATARRPMDAPELTALGVRVEALDVADPASVKRFARALGGLPVDTLINNAGIGGGSAPLAELDPETLLDTFRVNTLGPLRVTQALLPNLRAGRDRRIVQITSLMGSIADNSSGGSYGYRASKAALNMVTKSLSIDLAGEGFVCAALHPGWVRTAMGGSNAPLSVEESVAGLLLVIDGLTLEQTGAFLDFDGETLPW